MSKVETKIVLEHFDDKLAQLLESVDTMMDGKLQPITENISELKEDVVTIKAAVKETNRDTLDLQQRVTRLESI